MVRQNVACRLTPVPACISKCYRDRWQRAYNEGPGRLVGQQDLVVASDPGEMLPKPIDIDILSLSLVVFGNPDNGRKPAYRRMRAGAVWRPGPVSQ